MPSPTVLVAYVTRAGYTRRIARAIGQRLRERGFEPDVADLELCIRHPERYDAVVLGGATRFKHPSQVIEKFITENRDVLARLPTAYFSIDGTKGAGANMAALFTRTGWRPTTSVTLPGIRGARARRALAWLQDRLEAKTRTRVEAPTDWARIQRFADEIAGACRASRRDEVAPSAQSLQAG